ncbi:ATP-binding cassette domain-containing protein [Tenacibaculum amylolyticum]|uniref:ATP-binding cassette domain-containing protein n=1 Tax=Tenacibaculum amylolyticum TaxID=104269 RepID=UPI0038965505
MKKLHIDSITKSYANKRILSGVFLSCEKGKTIGLLGRNGSGKSTLLKIVFGIEKCEYKFVKIGNKVINSVSDGRNLLNYLPQENFLPNNVKIKKLIRLFLDKKERIYLYKNEHIKPLLNKTNHDLSGGEKRIVEILLIVHSSAPFILLDEPFNGLSPITRSYIINYLKKMKSLKGYIITDHDYKNVIALADDIVFLKDGYLKPIKTSNELIDLGYLTKDALNLINKKPNS